MYLCTKDEGTTSKLWYFCIEIKREVQIRMITIDKLRTFVRIEENLKERQVLAIWAKAADDRVKEGEAIVNVRLSDLYTNDQGLLVMRAYVKNNLSKFRVGDTVRLHRCNPKEPLAKAVLLEDNGDHLVLYFDRYSEGEARKLDTRHSDWMIDRDYANFSFILDNAFSTLESSDHKSRIMALINGATAPAFTDDKLEEIEYLIKKSGVRFNEKQKEAFYKAVTTKNFYVIQGPPGTGKTHVLALIALVLAKVKGERVLITSQTHRAINNALVKIAKQTGYPLIGKIGYHYQADDLKYEGGCVANAERLSQLSVGGERFDYYTFNESGGGVILGGSCFHLHTARLKNTYFDTIIFDEAGQLNLPVALAGMVCGSKYIFIGDHCQMSPIIVSDEHSEEMSKSIFETVFTHHPGTMLDTTYRMNEEITKFPSDTFYNGKLQTFEAVKKQALVLENTAYPDILANERSCIFVDLGHEKRRMVCDEEATLAANLIADALKNGVPAHEIAVIAPYRAQGRLIRKRMWEHEGIEESVMDVIVVDTVERIQGQERSLILISLTSSDTEHLKRSADFYFQPNRLNVALTRAKERVVVLGSRYMFDTKPDDLKHRLWVSYFRDFYLYCCRITQID